MTIRESLEQWERTYLSPYASHSADSKGRLKEEEQCDIRPVFQRDRDRIVHCRAFRRLKDKTQVFLSPEGDHYRTRLTHTLEVSQNARTIAKALKLNEELVEAIALGHDLGHTPFGHAGERALNEVNPYGFQHNIQSVRVVERLEKGGEGLNLTWEAVDGILHHKSSGNPFTLEGQIVRLSDKIAYLNHDIDDAIRGGILSEDDIPERFRNVLGQTARKRLDTMIHDVITNSMDMPKIRMSKEVEEAMKDLRMFMFEHVYLNPLAKSEEEKAIDMIKNLYWFYTEHLEEIPQEYRSMQGECGVNAEQMACDYIAGMTDTYAVKKFEDYFVPKSWKI